MNHWNINLKECQTDREYSEVKKLLRNNGLELEEDIDKTYIIMTNNKVVATASIGKNVFKSIVIDKNYRGQGFLNILITELKSYLFSKGEDKAFIYTHMDHVKEFKSLGFKELVKANDYPVLLEDSLEGIDQFRKNVKERVDLKKDLINKKNLSLASLVMNCNPFTEGHLFLIEKAAEKNDLVLIFVVEEELSYFSFNTRYELIKKGTEHLDNIILVTGGDYIISYTTFPDYFSKSERKSEKIEKFCRLDARLFGKYFGEYLKIDSRYIGSEPQSYITSIYNQILQSELPSYGILVKEIPRIKFRDKIISASLVRQYINNKEWKKIKPLVPETTYEYIINNLK